MEVVRQRSLGVEGRNQGVVEMGLRVVVGERVPVEVVVRVRVAGEKALEAVRPVEEPGPVEGRLVEGR